MSSDLKRGFQSLVSAKVLTSVIGVLTLPLVVRVLGPDGYGDYAFLLSTFSMFMLLVSPAVTEGVQKYVAEDREEPFWRERVVGFYLEIATVLAILGGLLLAAVSVGGLVGRFFEPRFELLFLLLAFHVLTAQLGSFTRHALLGLHKEHVSESLSVLRKFVGVSVGLGLAFLGFGVAGFLTGHILAALLFAVVGGVVLRSELDVGETVGVRIRSLPVRELLTFNAFNIVLVVMMQSLFHTDVLMLRTLVGSEGTGLYKAALVLAEYIWLVPIALQRLLLHSASTLWSRGERARIESLASRLTRYVFLTSTLLALGIFVLADRFVPLYYGSSYAGSTLPLVLLLPGAVGFALARPLYGINQAKGNLLPLVVALGVAAGGNVILNFLLIPMYGTAGAAVATSTSYGSMFVLQVAAARYLGYAPIPGTRPLRLLATVVVAAPLIVGLETIMPSTLVALALVPPLGFLLFGAVALLTGAIDGDDVREGIDLLPGPFARRLESVLFTES